MPMSQGSSNASWLRDALEGSDLAGWLWDVPADTVRLSASWKELLGEPPAETLVPRRELAALVHPDDLPRVVSVLDGVLAGRAPAYEMEHRVRVASGAYRWIESRGKVIARDADGRPLIVTGTNADITARRRAEEMLAAREMQLRLVCDSVPAMIVELDASDRIRYCNIRYAEFFGKSSESLIGQTFAEAVDRHAWERYAEHRERLRAGLTATYERVLVRPDRPEVRLHIQLVPRIERGGAYVGCYLMAENITERQRLERMKEDFIRSVTHELRTPLQAIRASLDGIAAAAPGVARTVASARASTERLMRLVSDILDYQRLRAGHRLPAGQERIDLVSTVRNAIGGCDSLAREGGVELRLQAPSLPVLIAADPDRVIQLVTNFVANALKHSGKGDVVDIAIERGDTHVRISVRDRGPGVPADFQPQLFKQFAQGQAADGKRRAGTGLGLAICKALAEQMNGRVGFVPAEGAGAVFWCELPA